MPSLKDLKNRIASVKATQKITKAMKMVAAAKLRRAQEAAEAARPYSQRMGAVLSNIAQAIGGDLDLDLHGRTLAGFVDADFAVTAAIDDLGRFLAGDLAHGQQPQGGLVDLADCGHRNLRQRDDVDRHGGAFLHLVLAQRQQFFARGAVQGQGAG
eukprot:gene10628-14266_t